MKHTHTLKEWWAWNSGVQAYMRYVGHFEGCLACEESS